MKLQELRNDFQQHRIETKKAFNVFMGNKTTENMNLYNDARDGRNDCLRMIELYN
jgi:hypothetical protein